MTMRQRRWRFNRTHLVMTIRVDRDHWIMSLPPAERDALVASALRRALKEGGAA